MAQEEPLTEQGYEREELGANPYTVPSIARIFQQLDELRPLPFEQLQRELPKAESNRVGFLTATGEEPRIKYRNS